MSYIMSVDLTFEDDDDLESTLGEYMIAGDKIVVTSDGGRPWEAITVKIAGELLAIIAWLSDLWADSEEAILAVSEAIKNGDCVRKPILPN